MKFTLKKFIISLSLFLISMPFAFANLCNFDAVHCVYYLGDQFSKNGKYVKSTLISNGRSNIHCTKGGFSDLIPQLAGKGWGEGKRAVSYEQCLNADCKSSKKLGTDTFTIVKNDQKYSSYPHYFKIRLLSNYGESCTTWK